MGNPIRPQSASCHCNLYINQREAGKTAWLTCLLCVIIIILCVRRQRQGGESKWEESRDRCMSLEMARDMVWRAAVERAMQLDQLVVALGQTRKFNRPSLKRAETSGTIERFRGLAKFVGTHSVRVTPTWDHNNEELLVTAEHFLVCSGGDQKTWRSPGKIVI